MNARCKAFLCAVLAGVGVSADVDAQRVGGNRGERVRPSESIPAVESYAPLTTSVFEVLSVRPSDRVMRIRGKDGKTADVEVQDHVYDLSKLKAGDKVKVDFFQPDEGDTRVRAAGVWPAQ
jgi:C-terminal processing protease CtpA/Prc